MKKLTHEEFLEKLYDKNEYYRNGEISLVEIYSGMDNYVTIIDRYGVLYNIKGINLLHNNGPSINTAVNKTEYIKSRFKIVHGDKYNYDDVNYIDAKTDVIINCRHHGPFNKNPYDHLNGSGCKLCSRKELSARFTKGLDVFIKEATLLHGGKYTYENFKYVDWKTKGYVNCPIHGEFSISPNGHLSGNGCRKCQYDKMSKLMKDGDINHMSYTVWGEKASKSKTFESFKLYVIVCSSDSESFIKIGKTFRSLHIRLRQLPYNYKVHKLITSEDPISISKIEHNIKKRLNAYNHKPQRSFCGQYECFNIEALHNGTVDKLIKELNVSG